MSEDADRLVARAIESVLDQAPGALDTSVPDTASAKLQPWAETAAPTGRNKRPLEELLQELEERVAADPDARAVLPRSRHPSMAFFDRFGRAGTQPGSAESGGRHRRRRRGGGGGAETATRTQGAAATGAPGDAVGAPAGRPPGSRRRSRRGRGGSGSGDAGAGARPPAPTPAPPRQNGAPPAGQQRAPGSGGRRRRGRRGRGGDRQPPA